MSQGCSIEIRTQIRGKMCVLVVFIKTNQSGIAQALNKNVLAIWLIQKFQFFYLSYLEGDNRNMTIQVITI